MTHRSSASLIFTLALILCAPCLTTPLAAQRFLRTYITPIEQDQAFDDEPSMAAAADGSIYVSWVSFRDGHDTLQVARYATDGDFFREIGSWQILGAPDTYVLHPKTIAAGNVVYVVYAAEFGGNWDVYSVEVSATGPAAPVRVSTDPAVDTDPAGAWHGGTLWVTWETNRSGARNVMLAAVRDTNVRTPESVTSGTQSNYDPTVAVLSNNTVTVAWHRFADNNYDVWSRERQPNAQWTAERRLTRAPSIDRHAHLVRNGDDLWLVYENAQTTRYNIGRTNTRRVMITRLTPNGLETLPGLADFKQLWERAENANIAFDPQGRLWVAFLKPRLPRGGWNHHIACYTGQKWIGGGTVSRRKGMDRRPSIAIARGRVLTAIQVDDLSENWTQNDPTLTTGARSQVFLGSGVLADLGPSAAPAEIQTVALTEPDEEFEAGRLRITYGEDIETPTLDYNGETLHLYYGNLHCHSDISVCNRCGDQSIDENYQTRRDINRLDFAAVTDHGYNIVPYLWGYTAKLARVNEDPGRLMTFLAEEWTSSYERYDDVNPDGYYGHRNLILEDPYFPKWWDAYNGDTPSELWAELRQMGASFVQIPHQIADTGNVPTDWRYTDEEAQPVAEIFQNRGSYEYHGTPRQPNRSIQKKGRYMQDVWNDGKVIGVIASPDHGGGYGKACVWSKDLSRKGILDAIRKRHTFGTTAARMVMEVRVNGKLMGEKIPEPASGRVEVKISARCPGDVARVEVCRNGKFIYLNEPETRDIDLSFVDTAPEPGHSYYYVRIIQTDNEIAWSSPVFFGTD